MKVPLRNSLSDEFRPTEIKVADDIKESVLNTETVLHCVTQLLEIDPTKVGRIESIRLMSKSISDLTKSESVQILEVLEHNKNTTNFLKYYPEDKAPVEQTVKSGINRQCVLEQRFFLAEKLDHENKIAYGLTGNVSGDIDLKTEQIPYIMMPPDKDEESALFYPLISGKECIGTIKLCHFSKPRRFTLQDLYFFRPVADAVSNLLHLFAIIDNFDKKNQEYETLAAENEERIGKLQIGERLTYQFLVATSHLHELAGLLGGMVSDREDFLAVIKFSNISRKEKSELIEIIERFSQHRRDAHKKVREMLRDRPQKNALYIKPHNIKDLINEQLEFYEGPFRTNEIRVKKGLKQADVNVSVDSSTIKYVLRILINNAMTALSDGPNRPRILGIHADIDNKDLTIRISDNGAGIPLDIQKKIFDAFFTTRADGSGIGLFWAKKTIEEDHCGTLMLERSFPNAGSIFRISLPLRRKGAH